MKAKLAIIMMAASVILAMTLAAASSVEGSFIGEPENESAVAAPNRGTGSTPTVTGGTSLVSSMPVSSTGGTSLQTGGASGIQISSTGGTSLQTGGASGIQKQLQIASEISDLEAPNGCYMVNATIVGGYYIAYYSTDDGSSARSNHIELGRPPFPEWTEYYVMVHKLGSNETTIYDPRVWELSKEYGKG